MKPGKEKWNALEAAGFLKFSRIENEDYVWSATEFISHIGGRQKSIFKVIEVITEKRMSISATATFYCDISDRMTSTA